MPGKQNYSLAIAWALDHDPVERVHQTLAAAEGKAAAAAAAAPAGEAGASSACAAAPADGTVAVQTQSSLKMRRSASAKDAAEVQHSARHILVALSAWLYRRLSCNDLHSCRLLRFSAADALARVRRWA